MTSSSSPEHPGAEPRSSYRELDPPAALRGRLVCTWIQVVDAGACDHRHRVLPDGCADLVWIGEAPPVIAGPATRWVDVRLAPRTTIVGVRLRPGGIPDGLGVPATELLDREVTLRDVWGRAADDLSDRAADQTAPESKLAVIEEALRFRWAAPGAGDPLVSFAVAWLTSRPSGRVQALADELGVSARHLQRRFAAAVGYGPKTFQRVLRFQRLLRIGMRRSRPAPLGALALQAGYADQAHMSREVSELAGRTPGATLGRTDSTLRLYDP
jgi:AraC-like DNA-binding protein